MLNVCATIVLESRDMAYKLRNVADICPAVGHAVSQEMVALALYSLGCAVPAYGDAIIYTFWFVSGNLSKRSSLSVASIICAVFRRVCLFL